MTVVPFDAVITERKAVQNKGEILADKAGPAIMEWLIEGAVQAIFKQARISRLIPYDPAEELKMPRTTQGKRRSVTDIERSWILKQLKHITPGYG